MATHVSNLTKHVERFALGPYRRLSNSIDLGILHVCGVCSTWTEGLLVLAVPKRIRKASPHRPCVLYEWDSSLTQVSELLHRGPCFRRKHQKAIFWDGAARIQPLHEHQQTYAVLCVLHERPGINHSFGHMQVACFSLTGTVVWSVELTIVAFAWPKMVNLPNGLIGIYSMCSKKLILVDSATGSVTMPDVLLQCFPRDMVLGDDGFLYAWGPSYSMHRMLLTFSRLRSAAVTATIVHSINFLHSDDVPEMQLGGVVGGQIRSCMLTSGAPVVSFTRSANSYFLNREDGRVELAMTFPDAMRFLHLDRRGRLVVVTRGRRGEDMLYVYSR